MIAYPVINLDSPVDSRHIEIGLGSISVPGQDVHNPTAQNYNGRDDCCPSRDWDLHSSSTFSGWPLKQNHPYAETSMWMAHVSGLHSRHALIPISPPILRSMMLTRRIICPGHASKKQALTPKPTTTKCLNMYRTALAANLGSITAFGRLI